LPPTGGHPFYQRLNQVLDAHAFDDFVEAQCAPFYAAIGRPSLTPGTYFRLLLIGYFEGIDSERGIAWRTADSLALRGFLGLGLDEIPPEHSTISRTRRLIDLETHRAVFTWILQVLATADLVKGKTIGIDATTLEANAALRSIVRRDSGETYHEFLTRLLMRQLIGVGTPRGLQGRLIAVVAALWSLMRSLRAAVTDHGRPVRRLSPIERQSIAKPVTVPMGVQEMVFTTGC
jgi:transposase